MATVVLIDICFTEMTNQLLLLQRLYYIKAKKVIKREDLDAAVAENDGFKRFLFLKLW
jgi:hypothetical protein